MFGIRPTMGTLTISAGTAFRAVYREFERVPLGTIGRIIVQDDAGLVLAEFTAEQQEQGFFFEAPAEMTEGIPHGAKYKLLITYPGVEPFMASYGTVVRAEPVFPLAPPVDISDKTVHFTDDFAGNYVSPTWIPVGGNNSLEIHKIGLNPPTLGPRVPFMTTAAARWYAPMSMDSVTVVVKVYNHGAGKFNVAVCGDYSMKSYIGVQWETGIFNNKLWLIKGTGPVAWTYVGDAVNHVTDNASVYTVKYNFLDDSLACYKGTSLSPVIEGTGFGVPHGEGFRYTGLSWATSLLSPGVELSAWEAKDGV